MADAVRGRSASIGTPSGRAGRPGYRLVHRDGATPSGAGSSAFRTEVRGRRHLPRRRGRADRPVAGSPQACPTGRGSTRSWWPSRCRPNRGSSSSAMVRRSSGRPGGASSSGGVGGVIPIWPGGDRAAIEAYLGGRRGCASRRRRALPLPGDRTRDAAGDGATVRVRTRVLRAPDERSDRADHPRRHGRAVSWPAVPTRDPRARHLAGACRCPGRLAVARTLVVERSGVSRARSRAALHERTAPAVERAHLAHRVTVWSAEELDLADDRLALNRHRIVLAPDRHGILAAMQYAESILDLVGGTPLVRISRLTRRPGPVRAPAAPPGQARDAQPGRFGQGPDRPADDRGGRAGRPAQARRHHHRADVRQHRPRPRHRRRAQGLPLHLRHGRQAVRGEAAAPARVRRRGRPVPDQRRPRVARRATTRSRPGSPATSRARSSPTSTGTRRTRPPTSGRPARSCGTRPTAGSPISSRASGPAARSPARPASSRHATRRSRSSARTRREASCPATRPGRT